MSEHERNSRPSDEMLVAFIDGELGAAESADIEEWIARDAATAERFDLLARGNLPYAEAFAPLLEAAPRGLDAMLAGIPSAKTSPGRLSGIGRRGFLGAAAACLIAGIAIDRASLVVERQLKKPDEGEEWRAVVAAYIELYTPETLSALSTDRALQTVQLDTVGNKLGMTLTPEAIALPGADFRRAQLLQYDGQPLAQLAYLDREDGPIALCFVRSDRGAAGPRTERRHGMNVLYWASKEHAFMLIGYAPVDRLEAAWSEVRTRLPV